MRREQSLKKELNEFLSSKGHCTIQRKADMKKSASWVKLGDAAYRTIKETHSRTDSRASKTKYSKSKNTSSHDSDRKILK